MIKAEIIAVGSELLLGGRADTNSIFLAELLAEQGIEVRFKTVVGDDIDDMCGALTTASRRARVVLISGGLGPTADDVTRLAVAKVTGHPLRLQPQALRSIKARFKLAGRTVTENQRRQAFLPLGSDLLRNSAGTAPGFSLQWKRSRIFAIPGVSHEARQMFTKSVLPVLAREGFCGLPIETRLIQTFGLIEGVIDERLKSVLPANSGIRLGLLASPLGVTISLTYQRQGEAVQSRSRGGKARKPQVSLETVIARINKKLGHYVFGEGPVAMEEVVGKELASRGLTVALAESCTGGLLGHRLTQVAGSSAYVDRGVICYSNQAKMELLGVPERLLITHGAVSAQVAKAMAEGIRSRSSVDLGLSVTGIAGPGGGTAQKPVGLVYIGLAAPRRTFVKNFQFYGDRNMIKLRSSQGALDLLRRWLCQLPFAKY